MTNDERIKFIQEFYDKLEEEGISFIIAARAFEDEAKNTLVGWYFNDTGKTVVLFHKMFEQLGEVMGLSPLEVTKLFCRLEERWEDSGLGAVLAKLEDFLER